MFGKGGIRGVSPEEEKENYSGKKEATVGRSVALEFRWMFRKAKISE